MVTRRQIELLSQRIEALKPPPEPIRQKVYLRFDDEIDEEFLARYPERRGKDGKPLPVVHLSFD